MDDQNKEIGDRTQGQVLVKPALGAPFKMIQTQIFLGTLEILLNMPARAA
jgi:hypothetical protein